MKVERIEIIKISSKEEPEVFYILPSGYKNRDIQVYESAYEELEVKLVNSDIWKSEKENLKIGF